MLAWGDREASRWPQYSEAEALRLCRRLRFAVAVVLCGLATGGCTYQLHSLLSKDDGDGDQTGSISRPGEAAGRIADAAPSSEADLAYARAAAADVLARSGKDASVPWQNPNTGAGGNITPLATSYSEGGVPCRDFLASYVNGNSESWLQGAACQSGHGQWEIHTLKPWRQS